MKQRFSILVLIMPLCIMLSQEEITKEDIFLNRTFNQDWVYGLNSMNDGEHYTTLDYGDTIKVNQFNYLSGEKVKSIIESKTIGIEISEYSFNNNETMLLLESNPTKLYRHSTESFCYLYNIETNELSKSRRISRFFI